MSDYGTAPTGFGKPKGRKNKQKKRNSGTAGKTILGIGAAIGTAYAANQAYQGYQGYQQKQVDQLNTVARQNAERELIKQNIQSGFDQGRPSVDLNAARMENRNMFGDMSQPLANNWGNIFD